MNGVSGADPGFENGGGAGVRGLAPKIFLANLGDFLKNLSLKGVGVRPPLDPGLCVTKGINLDCECRSERSVLFKKTGKIGQNGFVNEMLSKTHQHRSERQPLEGDVPT